MKCATGLACDDGWWVASPASCQDGAPVDPVMAEMGESVMCGRAGGSLGICVILSNVRHHSPVSLRGFTIEFLDVSWDYFGQNLCPRSPDIDSKFCPQQTAHYLPVKPCIIAYLPGPALLHKIMFKIHVSFNFLTWILYVWLLCCQAITCQVWKCLIIDMDFNKEVS